MATAIKTDVGQRQALLTPQATNFSAVQAAKAPESTSGKELAAALGVLQPAITAAASGIEKDQNAADAMAATAMFNNLSDVDKAIVIGHPAYADKSVSFRRSLMELQTDRSNRLDNQTLEGEIQAGQLKSAQSVQARAQELRANSIGGSTDLNQISRYDAEYAKTITKYELVGSIIKGREDLATHRTVAQDSVTAAFTTGGAAAGMAAFRKSMKPANWNNSDANGVLMSALESSVAAKGAGVIKSLEAIEQMRNYELTDESGKVIGKFGAITGHPEKLQALETRAMARGAKEATLELEHLTISVNHWAALGEVEKTTEVITHLTNHSNPSIAEWAKGKVADFVMKAQSARESATTADNAELKASQIKNGTTLVTRQDYEALLSATGPGSLLEQEAVVEVYLPGRGGKMTRTEVVISPEDRKKNLRQYAIEKSNSEHEANPNETNADWYLRDYKVWSKHGMVPPHHAALAKQGLSAMRSVSDNADPVSAGAVQVLRQYQLLQNNAPAAKELFGADYDYLMNIDHLERYDGMSTKNAAKTINNINKMYLATPTLKTKVDEEKLKLLNLSTGIFSDDVKNGPALMGDFGMFVDIAISSEKSVEASLQYAIDRIKAMPLLHGSKVRPYVAQSLVVDANSTPDELLQSYIKEKLVDTGQVPEYMMGNARIIPVEEAGKVVGFKFAMNESKKGAMFGFFASSIAPNGSIRNNLGAEVYLPVSQINDYGADERTAYGIKVSKKRSRLSQPIIPSFGKGVGSTNLKGL